MLSTANRASRVVMPAFQRGAPPSRLRYGHSDSQAMRNTTANAPAVMATEPDQPDFRCHPRRIGDSSVDTRGRRA